MAWNHVESVANGGSDSVDVTFASAPSEGSLIVLAAHTDDASATALGFPAGFTEAGKFEASSRTLVIQYKVAGASEGTTYTVTNSEINSNVYAVHGMVWNGESLDSVGTEVTASATDETSISVGPLTAASNDLCVAAFFNEGGDLTTSIGGGFTDRGNSGGSSTDETTVATLVSSGGDETAAHNLSSSPLRQSAVLVNFVPTAGGGGGLTESRVRTTKLNDIEA